MLRKKKKVKKVQLGVTDELPEGIFGDTSMPDDGDTTPYFVPFRRSEGMTRAFFGYKRSVKIDPLDGVAKVIKKKKKKKRAPVVETPKKKQFKAKPSHTGSIPQFQINYDATLPKEAEGLPMDNVVGVTEDALQTIIRNTEGFTNDLSKLMLNVVTPSVLAFDASSNYVRAVLKSGLKIDTDIDQGVMEAVQCLSRIEVISFYIDRMNVPAEVKARLREKFVDGMSEQSLSTMKVIAKGEEMGKQLRELDAVLVKRSEAKQGEKNARSARTPKQPDASEIAVQDSVRKTRNDRPIAGF